MNPEPRRDTPTRDEVALGAFLHDIGKFYQRARGSRRDMPEQVLARASDVLPSFGGHSTHWHALWTDAFFSELVDPMPFPSPLDKRWVRDCAVYHHKPLQDGAAVPQGSVTWIVTEADRIASGLERKARDAEEDREPLGRDSYRKTLLASLFSNLMIIPGLPAPGRLRQPLRRLDAETLSPVATDSEIDANSPAAYAELWDGFAAAYGDLAKRVGDDVTAYHEGILALSERFTWAIPSSTMDEPDLGLHDHARAVAAVASCLHAHHKSAGDLGEDAAIRDRRRLKFRFLVGDLSGIQTALFRLASEGASGLARTLRGRSLRFQLIAEAASRLCLQSFALPPYCVLQNAGGRFLLLVPFDPAANQQIALNQLRTEIDRWMRAQYHGDLILNLALSDPFAAADLLDKDRARSTLARIGLAAEEAKQRPLTGARDAVYSGAWDSAKGVCRTCGARPAAITGGDGLDRCVACHAEIELGRAYPKAAAIVLDRRGIPDSSRRDAILGFNVGLPDAAYDDRPALGWRLRGAPDHANLPAADRFAGAYVPQHTPESLGNNALAKARRLAEGEAEPETGDILTFAELAELSREDGRGRPMLAALKADVDRLGQVFSRGLGDRRSLARTAALSRLMDAFFTGFLPHLLSSRFANVYTVYAGGDDLLLLGPWLDVLRLARDLREEFRAFVGGSAHVTLSAGIALFAPRTPVTLAAAEAEKRLEKAKDGGRDRIHAVLPQGGKAVSWKEYGAALDKAEWLNGLVRQDRINAAMLYKLLWLDDRRRACQAGDTRAADWLAKLGYHLWRALPKGHKQSDEIRTELLSLMGLTPDLKPFAGKETVPARLALSIAIYRNR